MQLAPCGIGAIPSSPLSLHFPTSVPLTLSFDIFYFSLSYSLHLFSCFSILPILPESPVASDSELCLILMDGNGNRSQSMGRLDMQFPIF